MSTKSICFSLVTAFAGPFFSIFCHCHTLIHVTLLCRRASACPSARHQHRPPVPPGWILGWRGQGALAGAEVTPGVLLRSSGSGQEPLQRQSAPPRARASPGYLLWGGGILRISTIWFLLFTLFSFCFHLGERVRIFKWTKECKMPKLYVLGAIRAENPGEKILSSGQWLLNEERSPNTPCLSHPVPESPRAGAVELLGSRPWAQGSSSH